MSGEALTGPQWRLLVLCAVVEMLSLAVWTGGLVIIIADVIPAVFNSFGGTEPGGRFLTRVFGGYNWATLVCLACLGLATASRARINRSTGGLSTVPSKTEVILTMVIILIALFIGLWVHPTAVTLQEQAFTAKDEAARKSAWESFFFMSHTVARTVYTVNLVAGLTLMIIKVRTWLSAVNPASRLPPVTVAS